MRWTYRIARHDRLVFLAAYRGLANDPRFTDEAGPGLWSGQRRRVKAALDRP